MVQDIPLNGGFICRKHRIGYKSKCPTCAFEENKALEVERYHQILEKIAYHYPTPIDVELDYEKAYSEIKSMALEALQEEKI